MEHKDKAVVVVGATGQQGGAVARRLLVEGWLVRLLTRNPNRPSLQTFLKQGADVIKGDLDQRESLEHALKGAYGVYSMQTFMGNGFESEERQGKLLADVARAVGVQHFVYSSIDGAERNTGIPHFESKWHIEQHIQHIALPATILRPTFFMQNFQHFFHAFMQQGVLTFAVALHPETRLQLLAVEDIGAFAAMALDKPQEFIGKALALAGDEMTMPQVAEVFASVIGCPAKFVEQPLERTRSLSQENYRLLTWLNNYGYKADIPALRARYPELLTLDAWLRKSGWDPTK